MFSIVGICCLLATSLKASDVVIHNFRDFAQEWPAPSLQDINGRSTGLTHRLPGTGSLIPTNDTNLELRTDDGVLLFESQPGDIDPRNPAGQNRNHLDMPAIAVDGGPELDYLFSWYRFTGVNVAHSPGAELGGFVGTDADNLFRFGVRPVGYNGDFEYFSQAIVAGVVTDTSLDINMVTPGGSDIRLFVSRGLATADPNAWWGAAMVGSDTVALATIGPLPFGDAPVLYAGVYHFDGGPGVSGEFPTGTAQLDAMNVELGYVPEPSTLGLAAFSFTGLAAFGWRWRKR